MKRRDQLIELRGLSINEISAKIKKAEKERIDLNQEKILGKLKNTSKLKENKLELARLNTILDEKVRAAITK